MDDDLDDAKIDGLDLLLHEAEPERVMKHLSVHGISMAENISMSTKIIGIIAGDVTA